MFHVARDYRNWILPFIAFIAVGIIFTFFSLAFNVNGVEYINKSVKPVLRLAISLIIKNAALSIYATVALFLLFQCLQHCQTDLVLHSSFKKNSGLFFIGVLVFFVFRQKQ
jgi:hypothetical protein